MRSSCEHLQRTSMYFDGELAPGDEREAADHIATCAECQAVLGDAVGLDAVLSNAKPAVTAAPIAPRRRWQIALGAATLVAAAAIAIVVLRPKPDDGPREHVALVLAPKRSLEVRFSGDTLGKHRPYEPPRDRAHEPIDPRALDGLEPHDLIGALASSGELVRATEVARKTNDARALSDLAAIALASGDPEAALDAAKQALAQDTSLPAAHWNLGLAARQLKLWRISRAAFQAVAARGERGWASEANQHVALLERELGRKHDIEKLHGQFQLLVRAGSVMNVVTDPSLSNDVVEAARIARAIREDKTPIDLADVRRFPSHALGFLYESLTKATPGIVDGLEPVARALDEASSTTVATRLAKRALVGPDRLPDPFAGDEAATEVPERCKNDMFAIPCAPTAWRIARAQLAAGKVDDAEHTAQLGRDLALREYLDVDYALLAEIHRKQGRNALAAADIEEAELASR